MEKYEKEYTIINKQNNNKPKIINYLNKLSKRPTHSES
jgi:hypothetical protein